MNVRGKLELAHSLVGLVSMKRGDEQVLTFQAIQRKSNGENRTKRMKDGLVCTAVVACNACVLTKEKRMCFDSMVVHSTVSSLVIIFVK
jgi:hypothetical protein